MKSSCLPEVDHRVKFSVNIYGSAEEPIGFDHIANLFNPSTVDACYAHDGSGLVGGIKDDEGKWNTSGHADRIIHVGEEELALFAKLYDEPGTLLAQRQTSRAPRRNNAEMCSKNLPDSSRHIEDIADDYISTAMWNENAAG